MHLLGIFLEAGIGYLLGILGLDHRLGGVVVAGGTDDDAGVIVGACGEAGRGVEHDPLAADALFGDILPGGTVQTVLETDVSGRIDIVDTAEIGIRIHELPAPDVVVLDAHGGRDGLAVEVQNRGSFLVEDILDREGKVGDLRIGSDVGAVDAERRQDAGYIQIAVFALGHGIPGNAGRIEGRFLGGLKVNEVDFRRKAERARQVAVINM